MAGSVSTEGFTQRSTVGILETCGPNEAMVKTGFCTGVKITAGGFMLNIPCLQQIRRLDLTVMTVYVDSTDVVTAEGVPVSAHSVVQTRIDPFPENAGADAVAGNQMLSNAAQHFLGFTKTQIEEVVDKTLEGHQRSILAELTVDEVYQDRIKFQRLVREHAEKDLFKMGIRIISYTLRDIKDPNGYLDSLGRRRVSEVNRDATIGVEQALSQQGQATASANREMAEEVNRAEQLINEFEKQFKEVKYGVERDVRTEQQIAAQAYAIVAQREEMTIADEEGKVNVIKTQKETELANIEKERVAMMLRASQRLPADAKRFKVETLAGAEAQKIQLMAQAEATAIEVAGQSLAKVIQAKGLAERDVMESKAVAWSKYGQAAYLNMIIEQLPELAAQITKPLAKTDKVVILGGDDEIGSAKVTGEILRVMQQLPEIVEGITGLNLTNSLASLSEGAASSP